MTSQSVRDKAAEAVALVEEVTATALPEPQAQVVPYVEAQGSQRAEIERRIDELDMGNTQSIVSFGSAAQAELQEISQAMLADVRNKDVGPAGDSLRDIVTTIRGFSVSELDVRRERSWWEKLLGRAAPFAKFTAKFEQVQGQIDKITDNLLGHEHTLLKDIKSLDMLYEKTLDFYDELALYIAAGEEKLKDLDATDIPAKAAEVEAAPENDQVMKAQELRDLRAARDDLERRVHDLKLTRQVTMQSLPSIRLVQENDKSLVTKINSTLVNTVPLWETQLAQAVTIQRSAEAAKAVRDANDLTNELLTANAKNLRESQPRGATGNGARRVRHRGRQTGQCRTDRHDPGKPADRRRGQGPPRRRRGRAEEDGGRAARHAGLGQGARDGSATRPATRFRAPTDRGARARRGSCAAGCWPLPHGWRMDRAMRRRTRPRRTGHARRAEAARSPCPPVRASASAELALLRTGAGRPAGARAAAHRWRRAGHAVRPPTILARNFIRIALYDEYVDASAGRLVARETESQLRRWAGPVRIGSNSAPHRPAPSGAKPTARSRSALCRATGAGQRPPGSRSPTAAAISTSVDGRRGRTPRLLARGLARSWCPASTTTALARSTNLPRRPIVWSSPLPTRRRDGTYSKRRRGDPRRTPRPAAPVLHPRGTGPGARAWPMTAPPRARRSSTTTRNSPCSRARTNCCCASSTTRALRPA